MENDARVRGCLKFALRSCTPVNAALPQRPSPKGLKCASKIRGLRLTGVAESGPNIRPLIQSIPRHLNRLENSALHANHWEAFNASLHRRCAAYRRKTTTYAKQKKRLKPSLNVYWIIHNFVRVHFTTRQVPAVALGIIEQGLSLAEIFSYPHAFGIKRNQCPPLRSGQ
jgi:hypothetical protein